MASEHRLIDANALIEKFRQHRDLFVSAWNETKEMPPKDKARVDELGMCIAETLNAPTVDAVEVVRCKDCKQCDTFYPRKEIGKEPVQVWYCDLHRCHRKPDDFCSYGERRTDNG